MEQENSMKRWWFNSMLFKKEFEHRCRLTKSMGSLGPIENASESKDPNRNDTDKNIQVKDSNGDSYSIYFDIENHIFEIANDHPFCSELESSFYRNYSDLNNGSKSKNPDHDRYMDDTQYTWNNHINSCIDSYLRSQVYIDNYIVSGNDNSSKWGHDVAFVDEEHAFAQHHDMAYCWPQRGDGFWPKP
ncbi:acetyl-coenzyme A carboxylase carboxyl transferase subunit beta, chloroplastic-like [Lactuca sativa]|uniref:acetyl-coenzyme A carboxylase carboxyl transferase subunit beta, chloroplastic-like n=1 Tax=Lactuca sativa TaxID=4236 RepID=UPI0022AE6385|nr:acetyl-coenzyme A carboxylase carboxyl transferase subunit beta, chloroplastic-like [Lactuca sativa]